LIAPGDEALAAKDAKKGRENAKIRRSKDNLVLRVAALEVVDT
jgi:hypothetical protein